MSMLELFSSLKPLGISLELVEGNLKINAPKSNLTPTLLAELREKKAEIISFLKNYVQTQEKYTPINVAEKKEYYVLSSAQVRLYVLQQMDADSTSYNIPLILMAAGDLDRAKLAETFRKLIARHESLRTSFHLIGDEPIQKIHDRIDIEIQYYDLNGNRGKVDETVRAFIRPFDLSQPPLIRVGLIETGDSPVSAGSTTSHIFMMDMHHIISDGRSMGIFVQEFLSLYNGETLPTPRIHYKDFVEWFNRRVKTNAAGKSGEYWLKQFRGEVPVLALPGDFPRLAVQSFEGAHIRFGIDAKETTALKTFALDVGATLFGVLLALFTLLLSKLSGQEDIVVGSPVVGRRHEDLSQVIGMFVNTLVLRNFPGPQKSLKDFVQEVGFRETEAFENQEYPFEELVEKVVVARDASRNPLFDVMLAFQEADDKEVEIPGLKLTPYPYDEAIAKFDLIFICQERDGQLYFTVEYCTRIFKEKSIRRFINYFKKIVSDAIREKNQEIGCIDIISEEEKQEILYRFNNFEEPFVGDKTIHQLFREQVKRTPHHISLVGSKDKIAELQLSFKKLDEISDGLAASLLERGAEPGDMVGILAKRSVEMIYGIIGILKASCAYVPLNPKAPAARNQFMLKDCNVKLLFTTRSIFIEGGKVGGWEGESMFIEESGIKAGTQDTVPLPDSRLQPGAALAYVIYTSGSTGMPKGVAVSHVNFCPLVHWGYRHLGLKPGDHAVQNLPYYFDWSVWEIFVTLTSGVTLYLVPEELLLNPAESVEFMNSHGLTILHVTPTQYQYIVNAASDPVTLRYLFIGAEKLTHDLVKRSLVSVDNSCRVFNQYGPTEATIISAVQEIHRHTLKNYRDLSSIPIGTPTGNTCLYIMDKSLNLCPVKIVGELYISGEGVAAGYINNPALTAEKFVRAKIPLAGCRGGSPIAATERLYKTGDMARWLPEGSIEYMGRIDEQVKIRGFRIELGEIENHLLSHASVKDALVIDREDPTGEKYLCAYIVYAGPETADLKDYLSGLLPDYMIPSYFIGLDRIPLNPNGKADRKALPAPDLTVNRQDFRAPRNDMEKKLAGFWADILGIEQSIVSIDSNFFDLGGHSLKANLLTVRIDKELNIKIPLTEIFTSPTIRELAAVIAGFEKAEPGGIPKVEAREYHPLSFNQQRMFILHQLDPHSPAYHIPGYFQLEHEVNEKAVEQALTCLIVRHESLRTAFKTVNDQVRQFILRGFNTPFDTIDISAMDPETKRRKRESIYTRLAAAPFDLNQAPLFRSKLVKLEPGNYQLMFNLHHIISDGWSLEILKKEFSQLYEEIRNGQETRLAPLPLQYKDFAQWHQRHLTGTAGDESSRFWKQKLADGVPILKLPADEEPGKDDSSGAAYRCLVGKSIKEQLKNAARSHKTTLFTMMFSIYIWLLFRLTGQEDIACSIVAAGRNHPSLQQIIGFFVNSVIFRIEVEPDESFADFIERINRTAVATFQHQAYPLELVFEELGMRYPDIPVSFNLLNLGQIDSLKGPDLFEPFHEEAVQDVKFDLEPYITEFSNGIEMRWVYKKNMFQPDTIEYIVKRYIRLMEFFVKNPGSSLNDQRSTEQGGNPVSQVKGI